MTADIHKQGQPPQTPDAQTTTTNGKILGLDPKILIGGAAVGAILLFLYLNNRDNGGGGDGDDGDEGGDGGASEADDVENTTETPITIERDPADPLKDDERIIEATLH